MAFVPDHARIYHYLNNLSIAFLPDHVQIYNYLCNLYIDFVVPDHARISYYYYLHTLAIFAVTSYSTMLAYPTTSPIFALPSYYPTMLEMWEDIIWDLNIIQIPTPLMNAPSSKSKLWYRRMSDSRPAVIDNGRVKRERFFTTNR